jgi:alpha-ketoglutarate-dependent taurine dioxygenase
MSFLPSPPRRLFFSALQAPKGKVGGATALTDFRKVYRDVPKKIRDKLASKKLRYTRTHHKRGSSKWLTNDITALNSWSDVFGTTNKTLIEEMSRDEGMPMRWEDNGETYVAEFQSEPFQFHPDTKESIWFNHAQVFHWTTFPAELFLAFRRSKNVRFLFRSVANWIVSFATYVLLRKKMALNVSYGDGTPISFWEIAQIRKAVHRNMVFNQWEQGDLLMIDNFSTSHGREPTYAKGRKIVVAWSDPLRKSDDFVYGLATGT